MIQLRLCMSVLVWFANVVRITEVLLDAHFLANVVQAKWLLKVWRPKKIRIKTNLLYGLRMEERGPRKTLTFLPAPSLFLSYLLGSVTRKLSEDWSWVIKVPIFKLVIFEHFLQKFIIHILMPFIYRSWPRFWQIHFPFSWNVDLKCHETLNLPRVIFSIARFSSDARRFL